METFLFSPAPPYKFGVMGKGAPSTLLLHIISLFLEGKAHRKKRQKAEDSLLNVFLLPSSKPALGRICNTSPPRHPGCSFLVSSALNSVPRALPPWTLVWPTLQRSSYLLASSVTLQDYICTGDEGGRTQSRKCWRSPRSRYWKGTSLLLNPKPDSLSQWTLSLFPWLCAKEEIRQNLWMLPKICHTKAKTMWQTDEKQETFSWVCTITLWVNHLLFPVRDLSRERMNEPFV